MMVSANIIIVNLSRFNFDGSKVNYLQNYNKQKNDQITKYLGETFVNCTLHVKI